MSERRTPESEVAINFYDANNTPTSQCDVYAVTERSEFGDSATFRRTPIPQHDVDRHVLSNFSHDREREEYETVSAVDSTEKQEEDETVPCWARELLQIVSSLAQAPRRDQSQVRHINYNEPKSTFPNLNQKSQRVSFAVRNQSTATDDRSYSNQNRNRQTSRMSLEQGEGFGENCQMYEQLYKDRQYTSTPSEWNYERLPNFDGHIPSSPGFHCRQSQENLNPDNERQYGFRQPFRSRMMGEIPHSQERRGDFQRDWRQSRDADHLYCDTQRHVYPRHAAYRGPVRVNNYRSLTDSIPCFSGKEDWLIWINRFEIVADRQGLNEDEKLDLLIPKMTGEAADLVFMQLPRAALWDYQWLIQEIHNRFRVIETAKSFAARFSQRSQRDHETAEAYAVELKRLYDKAHRGRDSQTRKEDLLRRFLDGLKDREARWQVEYVKEPENIDEAVYQVVSFVQMRGRLGNRSLEDRKMQNYVRRATQSTEEQCLDDCLDNLDCDSQSNTARRATESGNDCYTPHGKVLEAMQTIKGELPDTTAILQKLVQTVDYLVTELRQPEQLNRSSQFGSTRGSEKKCFVCGAAGHFKRDCPLSRQNLERQRNDQERNPHLSNQTGNWRQRHQTDNYHQSSLRDQSPEINESWPQTYGKENWQPREQYTEKTDRNLNWGGPNSMVGGRSEM